MTSLSNTDRSVAGRGALGAAGPWILAALLLGVLPMLFGSPSSVTIMNQMAITIVFALSYNMLLGQAGMLSFGHAVYMGLGGFFAMHVLNWIEEYELTLPLPFLPLIAGLFAMLMAALIGLFSTRRAGTVFAMISLGVGELVAACSVIIVAFFGGEEGVSGDRTVAPFLGMEFLHPEDVYYLIAFWLLLSALGMYLFSLTPLGRMANAVRDNPERAEFLGYSARWVRYGSFVASGFFAGVAGGLFAINYEILTEENLNLATSGMILLVTFLGGTGYFVGPVVGAVVFTLLQSVLSLQTEIWQLYVGILFVATVMFFPQGLAGLIAMHGPAMRAGRLGSLAGPYARVLIPGAIGAAGVAALFEMFHHLRTAAPGDEAMTLFWITFDTHSAAPWIVAGAAAAAGLALAARGAPAMRAAWDEANRIAQGGAK